MQADQIRHPSRCQMWQSMVVWRSGQPRIRPKGPFFLKAACATGPFSGGLVRPDPCPHSHTDNT